MESDELKDVQQTMLRRLNNLLEEQMGNGQRLQKDELFKVFALIGSKVSLNPQSDYGSAAKGL